MPDNGGVGTHWLDYVKQAAVQAVMTKKPCDYTIGTVVSTKPLKIRLSEGDGLELPVDFIHLSRNVTDYEMEVTITDEYGWKTEDKSGGSGDSAYESHNHNITVTKKKIMIHTALKKGDKVVMVRKWGGQDYIVLDKVVM